MKLVWEHTDTDGYTYSCICTIPFEYLSKDDFVLHVLELCDKEKLNGKEYPRIDLLGIEDINIDELYYIENEVYTLEEWFEKEKQII